MEFDNRFYFFNKAIKLVVKLQPNPGDAIPNFVLAGKGLSILVCRPKTMVEIEDEHERAAVEWQTVAIHMLPEALQLEKGNNHMPAGDYDQLNKNLSMFMLWNAILLGDWFGFVKRLQELYQVLLIPSMSGMDHEFTAMLCKQVTWAIVNNKCNYFYKRLLSEDFQEGTPCQFLKSLLDDIIFKNMLQEPIH